MATSNVSCMIQIVWRYVVREERRGEFELAYGPGGAWHRLFGEVPGYRGTVLLHDARDPRRYLTVDTWDGEAERDAFLAAHRDAYAALDASFAAWTEAEEEVGVFHFLAEAAVRPRPVRRSHGVRRVEGVGSERDRSRR